MKIKAVIFDMDGVLIEAKEWHYEALNKALALFGYEITRSDHLAYYDGLPTRTKLNRLSQEQGLPAGLHSFINDMKQQYTITMILQYCRPCFKHEYALSRLKAEGYKLAVCSNSVRITVDLMMQKSGLDKYLDFSLSNQDVVRPKPDPQIYLSAISRLGLQPQECLILEDNQNGIKAAIASGAHLLQVETVEEVTWDNIRKKIAEIEAQVQ